MSKPSGEPTVNHEGDEDNRVDCEGHGEEARGQKDGVLDRVEAGAREGGRVVALVVQLVDVLVQEPALHLEVLFNLENKKRHELQPDLVQEAS